MPGEIIRPNDVVKHLPTGEEWLVCGVNTKTGHLIPYGYPFPTIAELANCELIESRNSPQPTEVKTALTVAGCSSFIEEDARPSELTPDTNFKVIDTCSPDTQARKAGGDNTDTAFPLSDRNCEADLAGIMEKHHSDGSPKNEPAANYVGDANKRVLPGIIRLVIERAEQACRYAFKHQEFTDRDTEYGRGVEDGWETGSLTCEGAIEKHVLKHINEDIATCNRRVSEPGTSVITWHTYDGTPETLPERSCRVLLHKRGWTGGVSFLDFSNGRVCWADDGRDIVIEAGHVWAYLPELPKGES